MKHIKHINEYWFSEEDQRYYSDDEQPTKEEEKSIEDQVWDEVEMRMRKTDDTLTFSEIMDIANTYGVDEEMVGEIMVNYVSDRQQRGEVELRDAIKEIIKEDFKGEVPTFEELYKVFDEYNYSEDMVVEFSKAEIKKMFISMTTDPNQLSLELN